MWRAGSGRSTPRPGSCCSPPTRLGRPCWPSTTDVIQAIVGKHWSLALVVQTLARVAAGRHVRRLVPLRAEGKQPVTPHLTAREREVLALLATGASTTQIRQHLDISEHTVRTHVRSLLSKLGVHSRVEALRVAHDRGLVQTGTARG